ncbi:MOSC domain-containing protein [Nocardioides pantholopis]|uniref:MOSC domain-containing protein n=1 Tax=Nocardioides pantholopis TaxID=2483798 RepID=UPI0013DE4958|nr:MOSC N-terminal beta barrel domain-containing protein [Nocardioides pantholopis]
MEIVGLWRYPVKSLQGEPVARARFEEDGLLGDRRWGIRDERTGRILTARRRPELLAATAAYGDHGPSITLPDGRALAGPGAETDRELSDWLGGPVSLVPAATTGPGRAEFFRDATDDTSEPVEWTMPAGRYVDAAPVLVLTTASLRAAARVHPGGDWDPRRFRPNVLVDLDGEGWLEDAWVGHALRLGGVGVLPTQQCVRCTMVTRAQPGLDADVEVFRTLARHHGGRLGVWAGVSEPGSVAVGDRASLAAAGSARPS